MRHQVTENWQTVSGLSENVRYSLQNQTGKIVFVERGTAPPDGRLNAFQVSPSPGIDSFAIVTLASGESLYVAGDDTAGFVVIDEAA